MKQIWKYKLEHKGGCQQIEMQKGAEIIHVQKQYDNPCIWAIVDIEAEVETRAFTIYGTGHNILNGLSNKKYIATWLQDFNSLVFHLFEILK